MTREALCSIRKALIMLTAPEYCYVCRGVFGNLRRFKFDILTEQFIELNFHPSSSRINTICFYVDGVNIGGFQDIKVVNLFCIYYQILPKQISLIRLTRQQTGQIKFN